MHKLTLAFTILCALAFLVGCADDPQPGVVINAPPPGALNAAKAKPVVLRPATTSFTKDVKPISDKYCVACHGDYEGVSFTKYKTDAEAHLDQSIFDNAAKQLEMKKMPPPKYKYQPTDEERVKLGAALKGI